MEYDTDQCTDEQLKDATRYILIRKLTQSYKFNRNILLKIISDILLPFAKYLSKVIRGNLF